MQEVLCLKFYIFSKRGRDVRSGNRNRFCSSGNAICLFPGKKQIIVFQAKAFMEDLLISNLKKTLDVLAELCLVEGDK
jgi:hypothetical protein